VAALAASTGTIAARAWLTSQAITAIGLVAWIETYW
jgi:hypothetical protein